MNHNFKMNYLRHNPQRKKSYLTRVLTKLIAKKHKVESHYALYLKFFLELLNLHNKKISVCEIGGADGWAISYEHENIKEKVMIDPDDEFKKILENKGVKFIKKALGNNELKITNRFDLIMLNHVIEHISDYSTAISELYAMLKPNGFVIVRCPDINSTKFKFWDDFTHVKPYSLRSLKRAFESHGFKTILSRKFSYNGFMLGFLFNKTIQNILSRIKADEVLYIGKK